MGVSKLCIAQITSELMSNDVCLQDLDYLSSQAQLFLSNSSVGLEPEDSSAVE